MKIDHNHKEDKNNRLGQGMLEFALAIPVFLILLLGIIEFGRMFLMYTSLFAASREGARYGAAVETLCDPSGLDLAARRVGFFAGDMTVAEYYDDGYGNLKACEQTVLGDRVHVTASINFKSITGVIPSFPLSSTARRTILRQVFLEWTLQPTSANAGGVPFTPTISIPTDTPTPPGPTNTPTQTRTPDPNVTPSSTPTSTMTPTQLPPLCTGADNWQVGMTTTTIYYDLAFTNNYPGDYYLNVVSISWDMTGGKVLNHIEFQKPNNGFNRVWTGPVGDGYLIWYPSPPLVVEHGGTSILRFVFKKENVTITDISLVLDSGVGECTLSYP